MKLSIANRMAGFSNGEAAKIIALYSVLGVATILGFVMFDTVYKVSGLLAGLGVVAYVFGLRHGVDADHIAAIDNATRKLMQEDQRPFTVGLWFSLGHSTIVVGLILALVLATRTVLGQLTQLQSGGAVIGSTISGVFLWLIGLVNLVILINVYGLFSDMRRGNMDQAKLEALLNSRGFLNRYFRPLFNLVRAPWQVYPIGVLFGLGFDTATEIALIAISVGIVATSSIPVWMILVLPYMFTCGMVLVDMTDGVTMRLAYGWAFLNPIRKIYYNLTVTVISIVVALLIGTAELLQVIANELHLTGPLRDWLGSMDFETIGFGIIIIFLASWLLSVAMWKVKRFDQVQLRARSANK